MFRPKELLFQALDTSIFHKAGTRTSAMLGGSFHLATLANEGDASGSRFGFGFTRRHPSSANRISRLATRLLAPKLPTANQEARLLAQDYSPDTGSQ
jgi:hypothetical protein